MSFFRAVASTAAAAAAAPARAVVAAPVTSAGIRPTTALFGSSRAAQRSLTTGLLFRATAGPAAAAAPVPSTVVVARRVAQKAQQQQQTRLQSTSATAESGSSGSGSGSGSGGSSGSGGPGAGSEQTWYQRLWDSPVGIKTVHFWAPVMKWALVVAGLADMARPAEKLSVMQNVALTATGLIWTRWCLIIKPRNMMLAAANFFLGVAGLVQCVRIYLARSAIKSKEGK